MTKKSKPYDWNHYDKAVWDISEHLKMLGPKWFKTASELADCLNEEMVPVPTNESWDRAKVIRARARLKWLESGPVDEMKAALLEKMKKSAEKYAEEFPTHESPEADIFLV